MSRIDRLASGFETPKNTSPTNGNGHAVVDGVDMMDPEVQDKILNPAPLQVMLHFDDENRPDREISILTAFTPNMVKRRTLDELGSLCNSILGYLAEKTPDRKLPTTQWLQENTAWFGWAASTPDVRAQARPLIAKLSNTPILDIEDGLSDESLSSITISLMILFGQMRRRALPAHPVQGATPPASAPAPSTLV